MISCIKYIRKGHATSNVRASSAFLAIFIKIRADNVHHSKYYKVNITFFVRVCLYVLRGHLLGKGWPLGSRLWCLL